MKIVFILVFVSALASRQLGCDARSHRYCRDEYDCATGQYCLQHAPCQLAYRYGSRHTCRKVCVAGLGANCGARIPCYDEKATCTVADPRDVCICIEGYTDSNGIDFIGGTCKAELGSSCSLSVMCSDPYAFCNGDDVCECSPGYVYINQGAPGGVCRAELGYSCSGAHVLCDDCNAECDCLTEVCVCRYGYSDSNGASTTGGVCTERSKSSYIRWGKTVCPGNGSDLVYQGYIAGGKWDNTASSSKSLCLPNNPTWSNYNDGVDFLRAYVYGAEIDTPDIFDNDVENQDPPCAVCKTTRSTTTMIPARSTCDPGWTLEYKGYLMASHYQDPLNQGPICLDDDPEFLPNGETNDNQHVFHIMEARCGSLPCPPYVDGRELACAVCSI